MEALHMSTHRSRSCVAGDRGGRNRDGAVRDIDTAALQTTSKLEFPMEAMEALHMSTHRSRSCVASDRGGRNHDGAVRDIDTAALQTTSKM